MQCNECYGTYQTVEAVVQEDQQHGLFLQTEAGPLTGQYSLHHTFEEEREMARLLFEHLMHTNQKIQ